MMSEPSDSVTAKDYIVFSLAGNLLAIESDTLVEVLEPIRVSALPLVPNYIDGLINLNGDIIPQINLQVFLQELFDQPYSSENTKNCTLLVVSVAGQLIALSVGMIQEPLQLCDEQLEGITDNSCYSACFSYQDSQVNILSIDCLQGVVKASDKPEGKRSFLGDFDEQEEVSQTLKEYLYVRSAEQVYGTLLSDVYEVVDVTEIKLQPNSPNAVVGVAVIRNTATLVFSLQALLLERSGVEMTLDQRHDANDQGLYSLLLIRRNNLYCGLLVDEVIGLQLIEEQHLHTGEHNWQQVITGDRGLITAQALMLDDFFDDNLCQKYMPFMPSLSADYQADKIPQQELLKFHIKGDAYALLLSDVIRIINNKDVQPLLEKQRSLAGAIEFDGSAIPVVDLGSHLGYGAIDKCQEFIVVNHNDEKWAFTIDSIEEIVTVDQPSIDFLSIADKNIHRSVKAYVCFKSELLSILDIDVICKSNLISQDVG